MAQLRKAHPFIAYTIRLGLIVSGTAVPSPIPALGLMAMNRRCLNDHVGTSSPR